MARVKKKEKEKTATVIHAGAGEETKMMQASMICAWTLSRGNNPRVVYARGGSGATHPYPSTPPPDQIHRAAAGRGPPDEARAADSGGGASPCRSPRSVGDVLSGTRRYSGHVCA